MTPKCVAHEQYDDFLGTIAIDENEPLEGQEHLVDELATRANVNTKEYSPVGFQFHGPQIDKKLNYTPNISLTLLATKIAESGDCLEDYEKYARENGTISLYRFEVEMSVQELLSFFKRLSLVVFARNLQELPFEIP